MIVLGVMDLDLAFRKTCPTITDASTSDQKKEKEKWDRSNRMSLMIMKRSILEVFWGAISESILSAKLYLKDIEDRFVKSEKGEIGTLLTKLVSMKYKEKGNIREYIMKMSNVVSKLRALKMEISDDLLMDLALISLPSHFGQFKISYNCQKDKWTINELISHCVEEEERMKRDKTENVYVATTSKTKSGVKRKKPDKSKDTKAAVSTQHNKLDKGKSIAKSDEPV